MKSMEETGEPEQYTLRRVAELLGCTPETIRALEKRGRLPKGSEPTVDPITGTRYWTREQVEQLKEWNDERTKRKPEPEP
ncbi:MAG: MerR family transcriptional regulator [Chloroflexota bacterium]